MIWILFSVAIVFFAGTIAIVRTLSHDVEQWHVDPQTAPDPSTPNWYRVVPEGENAASVYNVSAEVLSQAFDRVVGNQSSIELLKDDRSSGGPVTWVQRSALFGFPDYISVSFLPVAVENADGGASSTLAIFSRARIGQSDLGVNKKRVTAWLAALEAEVG